MAQISQIGKGRPAERLLGAAGTVGTVACAFGLPLAAGFGFARAFGPTLQSKYFPWITGRALGIAAYLCLAALVGLGLWMRHPWRFRWPVVHAETRLRLHAALGSATVGLVGAHLVVLASDRYAGVGWLGAFVPGLSRYRSFAVSLGVVALFFMIILLVTARAAGRVGARHWHAYHQLAALTFPVVWLHGVLAGTDTVALRALYVGTGLALGVLGGTRYAARRLADGDVASRQRAHSVQPGPLEDTFPGPR